MITLFGRKMSKGFRISEMNTSVFTRKRPPASLLSGDSGGDSKPSRRCSTIDAPASPPPEKARGKSAVLPRTAAARCCSCCALWGRGEGSSRAPASGTRWSCGRRPAAARSGGGGWPSCALRRRWVAGKVDFRPDLGRRSSVPGSRSVWRRRPAMVDAAGSVVVVWGPDLGPYGSGGWCGGVVVVVRWWR